MLIALMTLMVSGLELQYYMYCPDNPTNVLNALFFLVAAVKEQVA